MLCNVFFSFITDTPGDYNLLLMPLMFTSKIPYYDKTPLFIYSLFNSVCCFRL